MAVHGYWVCRTGQRLYIFTGKDPTSAEYREAKGLEYKAWLDKQDELTQKGEAVGIIVGETDQPLQDEG
jgi:hypothetical protein